MRLRENLQILNDVSETLSKKEEALWKELEQNAQQMTEVQKGRDARLEVLLRIKLRNRRDDECIRYTSRKGLECAMKGAIARAKKVIGDDCEYLVVDISSANVLIGGYSVPLSAQLYVPMFYELYGKYHEKRMEE